ncbi:MAG: hypothetical protein JSV86_05620 [Gemmatimonadota bacterium]|nr:MAG: hypothetical protein JSV86_05620 [Gemmatimonadota bacterium]
MPSPQELAWIQHLRSLDDAAALTQLSQVLSQMRDEWASMPDARREVMGRRVQSFGRQLRENRRNELDNRLKRGVDQLPSDEWLALTDAFQRHLPGGQPFTYLPPDPVPQHPANYPAPNRDAVAMANLMNMLADSAAWERGLREREAKNLRGRRATSIYDNYAEFPGLAPPGYGSNRRPL